MRLSQQRIRALQKLLKDDFGLDYSEEEVRQAGTAILRFVVAKLRKEAERAAREQSNEIGQENSKGLQRGNPS